MKNQAELVCGLDPGRDKCGLAIVDRQGLCVHHEIAATEALEAQLQKLQAEYGFHMLIMGNGTTSKQAGTRVRQSLPEVELVVVDEYRTTDAAREEYWRMHRPTGWRRLLPHGMLVPPEPVDDLAALILARRYVKGEHGRS